MKRPVCGFMAVELRLAENHSLKGKRQVVKSLKDRLRKQFNLSVAELDPLDDWRTAVIGISTLNKDRKMVESTLCRAQKFIEDAHLAEIIDTHTELW